MAPLSAHDLPAVEALFLDAAREAGAIVMDYFRHGETTVAAVHNKLGGSPVTDADFAVDRFLHECLRAALPLAGWLSEETADSPERLGKHDVLVVDPIDGTRAFVCGSTAWAISIGLVSGDRPVVGVVSCPALGTIYHAVQGGGAWRDDDRIEVSARAELSGARVAGPPGFAAQFVERGGMTYIEKVPSLASRFVRVAEGQFDIGIASGNAHDWDVAAADLILEEAGGWLTTPDGAKLAYNNAVPRHPPLFGAARGLHPSLMALVHPAGRAR